MTLWLSGAAVIRTSSQPVSGQTPLCLVCRRHAASTPI